MILFGNESLHIAFSQKPDSLILMDSQMSFNGLDFISGAYAILKDERALFQIFLIIIK